MIAGLLFVLAALLTLGLAWVTGHAAWSGIAPGILWPVTVILDAVAALWSYESYALVTRLVPTLSVETLWQFIAHPRTWMACACLLVFVLGAFSAHATFVGRWEWWVPLALAGSLLLGAASAVVFHWLPY